MEKYYLGISLTRWTMIHYCSSMWKIPEFRNHLIQGSNRDDLNLVIIPTKLRKHLDELILPRRIKNELRIAVGRQGHKIQLWCKELRHRTPDITSADCFNHIHWSCYGDVDRTESMKSLYKAELFPITFATWKLLCEYCIEECILDFWTKVSTNKEHNDVFQKIATHRDSDVLIHYWKFRVTHNLLELQETIHNFDDSRTPEENVLMAPIFVDYARFRYFWNRFDEPKKQSICRIVGTPGGNFYGLELNNIYGVDLFMFILQQLMIRGSKEVLNKITILPTTVPGSYGWPHSNTLTCAVRDFHIHNNSERFDFIDILLWHMYIHRTYNSDDAEIRRIFYDLWKVYEFVQLESLIEDIVGYRDIESIRYVFRHVKTLKARKKIINALNKWSSINSYRMSRDHRKFWNIFTEAVQGFRRFVKEERRHL